MLYNIKIVCLFIVLSMIRIGWGCDEGYIEIPNIPWTVYTNDNTNFKIDGFGSKRVGLEIKKLLQ